ncbi:MAG: hypothetical protein HY278_08765 [candidate division NC10 bacterium]|nr:hypothetical protein [candidate division NC10 bacterium]
MLKNLLALLIAGALILLSALEITYMSTKSPDRPKQGVMRLDQAMNERVLPRGAVSIHGFPTQVAPGSVSGHVVQPQPSTGSGTGFVATGASIDGSIRADAMALGQNQ